MHCLACGHHEMVDDYEIKLDWNVDVILVAGTGVPPWLPLLDGYLPDLELVQTPPLSWFQCTTKGSAERTALVEVDGAWRRLVGEEGVREIVGRQVPGLDAARDQAALMTLVARLLAVEVLKAREDVDDLRDPRWHVMPLSDDEAAQWEPPRVDGPRLSFVVHARGALQHVLIDVESGNVVVSTRA